MPLSDVFAGEYAKWDGLPGWSLEQAAMQLLPVTVRQEAVERRRAIHRFEMTAFQRPVEPSLVELWLPKNGKTVTIAECGGVNPAYHRQQLASMGDPDLLLEDRILRLSYLVEDFVYVQRGIALSIGRPLDQARSLERTVVHVRLFPPMSEQRYLSEVDDPGSSGMPRPIH